MKNSLFALLLLTSLQSHAVFGLGGLSREQRDCVNQFTQNTDIQEHPAKDLCKRNSSAPVVSCTLYFYQHANNSTVATAHAACLDGIRNQTSNFQTYETCVVTLANGGNSFSSAQSRCVANPRAHIVAQTPPPQPAQPVQQPAQPQQPAYPTYPSYGNGNANNGGYYQQPQQPQQPAQPVQPQQPVQQPTATVPSSNTVMEVPPYEVPDAVLDPSGNLIPDMPAAATVDPTVAAPAAPAIDPSTMPAIDPLSNGNFQDLPF